MINEIAADAERVKRLRKRANHFFAASVVINVASFALVLRGGELSLAFLMQLGALSLVWYTQRFVRLAKEIAKKYES
jgi:hypothetical protein